MAFGAGLMILDRRAARTAAVLGADTVIDLRDDSSVEREGSAIG